MRGGELSGFCQSCSAILGKLGLGAPLLSISQKDAWRRHLRFLNKQKGKADSLAAVTSAEEEPAQLHVPPPCCS